MPFMIGSQCGECAAGTAYQACTKSCVATCTGGKSINAVSNECVCPPSKPVEIDGVCREEISGGDDGTVVPTDPVPCPTRPVVYVTATETAYTVVVETVVNVVTITASACATPLPVTTPWLNPQNETAGDNDSVEPNTDVSCNKTMGNDEVITPAISYGAPINATSGDAEQTPSYGVSEAISDVDATADINNVQETSGEASVSLESMANAYTVTSIGSIAALLIAILHA
jgi:hypothetical protein